MQKKNISNRKFLWGAVVVSFSLAILDMMYLRDVFEKYADFDVVGASIVAFALATIANVAALLWGRQKGLRKSGKSFMWSWIVLGIVYFLIRFVAIYNEVIKPGNFDFSSIIGQLLPIIILTISYVGTGTTLEWAGKQLWDINIITYLKTQKVFHEEHAKIANNHAALWEMIENLQKYNENYISLDKQYEKHKDNIRKNEKSTMARIVSKVIANNPSIDPSDANRVMEAVLAERDQENAKNHQA